MANNKLQIDDFEEIDYSLIAIHSSLEHYRLAYFINKYLPINLSKNKNNIQITAEETNAFFTRFDFDDKENSASWNLISNQTEVIKAKKSSNLDLFVNTNQQIAIKVYLISDFKKVSYFLKIENEENRIDIEKTIAILKSIKRISMVYAVDLEKIKNKNNLIF